jgi:hypothetical protein
MIGEWLRLPSVYRSKTRFYLIRLFTGFFPGWYHQKLLLKFFELFLISRKITLLVSWNILEGCLPIANGFFLIPKCRISTGKSYKRHELIFRMSFAVEFEDGGSVGQW